MSADQYYLRRGFTPQHKTTMIHSRDTIVVWSPRSNTRVTVTDLSVASIVGGTIAFYINEFTSGARAYDDGSVYDLATLTYDGTDQNVDAKILEFFMGGSATIAPAIGMIQTDLYDTDIVAAVSASSTEGWRVDMTGFDIP